MARNGRSRSGTAGKVRYVGLRFGEAWWVLVWQARLVMVRHGQVSRGEVRQDFILRRK